MSEARFEGLLYRALNPLWARNPLSGEGAALYGGRFNPRGMPAIYCSLSPVVALREANQVGTLQPTVLVAYRAAIENIFDSRDGDAVRAAGLEPASLGDPGWRETMLVSSTAPTQHFAEKLKGEGWNGLLVRSFAPGSGADDLNLVLWRWSARAPAKLELVDDEGRLEPAIPRAGAAAVPPGAASRSAPRR